MNPVTGAVLVVWITASTVTAIAIFAPGNSTVVSTLITFGGLAMMHMFGMLKSAATGDKVSEIHQAIVDGSGTMATPENWTAPRDGKIVSLPNTVAYWPIDPSTLDTGIAPKATTPDGRVIPKGGSGTTPPKS